MNELDHLQRRARRVGCEVVSKVVIDEHGRLARAYERLQDDYADLVLEKRELGDEVARLRKEVGKLHWQMKTRTQRMKSRWFRLRRRFA